ncbi:Pkinase-domain-containing protein [Microthyrium microscopicum]|uniref:mitogen-activated protein kinase n=1 Tax=Microthyrium microscopicum TaxID=703497 RepID=A0A6A6U7C4_9PEZI|nr:Pkinase-domain-containing protein [Microthyrium microscopicum]
MTVENRQRSGSDLPPQDPPAYSSSNSNLQVPGANPSLAYSPSPIAAPHRQRSFTENNSYLAYGAMHGAYRNGFPPPPPPPQTPIGISLPGPPPRQQHPQHHGLIIPPPPSGPPSAVPQNAHSFWGGRQQSYPPPPPASNRPVPSYNPSAYSTYQQQTQQSIRENSTGSLVSATYIPGGEGWGPGVGIPPPDDLYYDQPQYGTHSDYGTQSNTGMTTLQTPIDGSNAFPTFAHGQMTPAPPRSIAVPPNGFASPGPPTATPQNPQSLPAALQTQQPLSPSDPGYQWPLERVLKFLATQNYPSQWIEVFREVNVHGNAFLDIGRNRGNLAMMHEQVYPRLADKLGDNFDVQAEMDRRKRLRRAVRKIVETGDAGGGTSLNAYHHKREHSLTTSAGPEGTVENSPGLGPAGTPTTALGDDSPDRFVAAPGQSSDLWNRRVSPSQVEDGRSKHSRDALRMADGRRRSRNSSQDLPDQSQRDGRLSPAPSPGIHGKGWPHGKATHNRDASTESTNRGRNALESNRPSPSEPPVKEHKNIFSRLKRKDKKDGTHLSPDESSLESPSSPANIRQPHYFFKFRNGSENSLHLTGTTRSGAGSRLSVAEDEGKRVAFVTPDGINYRVIDISRVDSAESIRLAISDGLDLPPGTDFGLHITVPLLSDHDDALSDDLLVYAKRSLADATGTLKLWATIPQNLSPYGTSSSHKMSVMGTPILPSTNSNNLPVSDNTDAGAEIYNTDRPVNLDAAAEEHRREIARKQSAYLESKRMKLQSTSPSDARDSPSITGRTVDFDNRRESPYTDPNRKSRDLAPNRPPPAAPAGGSKMLRKADSLTKKGHTSRRSGSERGSGSKRDSQTDLIIYESNPLDKERSNSSVESGRSAMATALGETGKRSGENSPSGAPPGSPDREDSPEDTTAGEVASSIHGLSMNGQNMFSGKPNLTLQMPGGQAVNRVRQLDTQNVSPHASQAPPLARVESKRGVGPNFDIKEPKIDFAKYKAAAAVPESPQSDSDDDGLFAMPINRGPPKGKSKDTEAGKPPVLTIKPPKEVQFQSPHSEQRSASTDPDDLSGENLRSATSASSNNPDDWELKANRRRSFASDVWAARPSAEGIIDNLDEFFPNINLDQPVIQEAANWAAGNSAPPNPNGYEPLGRVDENDTLGSDESTLKAKDTIGSVASVAQRQMQRTGGGLGRAKSIREVVQRNYIPQLAQPVQQQQAPLPARINTIRQNAAIVRRKSTKMFGAKIEQVKPNRGSRIINLDTIHQEEMPQMSATAGPSGATHMPQRQPTFKWVRGQLIGKGTFGRVYLGMNIATGEFLAVKQVEVNPKAAGQEKERLKEMVRSLDNEIDFMEPLEHPNIVSYLGCERKEFSISIFLEYIPGGSIGSVLRKHGKFPEEIVSSLTRQCLKGLAYLHDEGILHRDLKADNILLDMDGSAKISDFGISKKTDNIYGNDSTNSMQGSVFWMAPEVIRSGGVGYSAKVDIWSLGCVVLEMFAGRRPWAKEEAIGAIYKLGELNEPPPIPDDVSSTISPQALSFMFDCFTIQPQERPTAQRLLDQPFCFHDSSFNFFDTDLYKKIRPTTG